MDGTHSGDTHPGLTSLDRLEVGQQLIYAGNRVATVSAELAAAFAPGDKVLVDPATGDVLHIPASVSAVVADAVEAASRAFHQLVDCSDDQVSQFFTAFAGRLADDESFEKIAAANAADVDDARRRGRSVTRLVLDERMRTAMIEGLDGWAQYRPSNTGDTETWAHADWTVAARRAPLGVVAFVFEGRPNVFADAAGVLRTGNAAVFRIGSDALATAEAIMQYAVAPAIEASGLPAGALALVGSRAHSAGWAMFSDDRVALAVARGSGAAVAQLGGVARQHGLAVSLHGTGGAWVLIDATTTPERVRDVVASSLDRKVCNTLNTVVLAQDCGDDLVEAVFLGLSDAAAQMNSDGRVHLTDTARARCTKVVGGLLDRSVEVSRADGVVVEPFATPIGAAELGREWEWEQTPEISITVVDGLDTAVETFNRLSPRFVVSVLTDRAEVFERAYRSLDAPFVGDGMTRWVDGQFALQTPELGLSNWQTGRMLGRGGILSGDGIYTVRYRASIPKHLHR